MCVFGFCWLQLSLDSIFQLTVLPPTPQGEEPLVAPLPVVTMGWTEALLSFTGTTETAFDLANWSLVRHSDPIIWNNVLSPILPQSKGTWLDHLHHKNVHQSQCLWWMHAMMTSLTPPKETLNNVHKSCGQFCILWTTCSYPQNPLTCLSTKNLSLSTIGQVIRLHEHQKDGSRLGHWHKKANHTSH